MLWRSKKSGSDSKTVGISQEIDSSSEGIERARITRPQNTDTPGERGDVASRGTDVKARELAELSAHGQRPFVIPGTYTVSGNIITHRPVAVAGALIGGTLTTPLAVVLPEGTLEARVSVDTLRVHGRVSSEVRASTFVEVLASGRIEGDLESPEIKVQAGASLAGVSLSVGMSRAAGAA